MTEEAVWIMLTMIVGSGLVGAFLGWLAIR